jgi:uncharacterized phiE125 gp8 family phage protein
MLYQPITLPTTAPITVAELRLQMGLLEGDEPERDSVLDANIKGAYAYLEGELRRAFLPQTWRYTADTFPVSAGKKQALYLLADLQAVTSITYVNDEGVLTTLNPSQYQVFPVSCLVQPAFNVSWPITRDQPDSVTIHYTRGCYSDAAAVPEDIKKALKIIAGQWEAFSKSRDQGISERTVAYAAHQLVASYKDMTGIF